MQEWFGILNKKNELIKRQMELNFMYVTCGMSPYQITELMYLPHTPHNREKEEDLEKRQFFINRELRPLMEIPGWLCSDDLISAILVMVAKVMNSWKINASCRGR